MRQSPPEVPAPAAAGRLERRHPLPRSRRPQAWALPGLVCLAVLAMALDAQAQSDAVTRTVAVTPNASVTQTFSSNPRLVAGPTSAGSITRVSAGVGLRNQTGLLHGFLDYSLSGYLYSGSSGGNSLQNSLNAALESDLIEGRAKLGMSAGISQSAVSAFGVQPGLAGGVQGNSTEFRNLRLTPSFKGPVGPSLRYTGQLSYAITDARNTEVGDSQALSAAVHLEPTTTGQVAWGVDASHQRSGFKLGRYTNDDRLYGTLIYRPDRWDLVLQASGGLESTDLATASRSSYTTWGLGGTWTPSPRTRLAAQYDHLFFGAAHSLVFEHRTALTSWRLSNSRRLSTVGDQGGGGGRGTAYDLLYFQAASTVPDPVKREAFVNDFLAKLGIQPTQPAGFLRSSATIQDLQEASVAWRNVRSSLVLSINRSTTQRLATFAGLVGDLANTSEVRLRGVSLDLSHRLTPQSNVNLVLGEQRGHGDLASQDSRQRQLSLQYSTRPTPHSDLSVGLRRAWYEVQAISYGESAVYANYGVRF